jgi:hypothetical protein
MDWNASWIWHPPTGNDDNFFLYARREVTFDKVPAEAMLRVTAGSLYKLYINGAYVGRGPNPSDPSRYYYDVYRVSSLLKPGVNVFAAECYTYGPKAHGVLGQNWGRGGLLFELRSPGTDGQAILVSDDRWRVLQPTAWDQSAQVNCNLLGDYKETYDSRAEVQGWMQAGFDDLAWKKPDVLGKPPLEPWTMLVEREIPFLRGDRVFPVNVSWESASVTYSWRDDWEVYHEQRLAPTSPHRSSRDLEKNALIKKTHADFNPAVILDFGRDVTGYPEIHIANSKGGAIDVLYGEALHFTRVDRFILRGGPQKLQPYNRRTFRYMKLLFTDTPDVVELSEVSMEMCTYPVNTHAGSFSCSDDQLNRIWEAGAYTMRMSMLDHFVDCPWRERTLYGGDLYAENLFASYAFGDAAMNRKCLRQMFNIQYPQGALPPYGPYRGCDGFYPSWTAFFGLGFTDHYRLTADRAFLDELWPAFEKLIEWAISETKRNQYGLMGDPAKGGRFDEWMKGERVRFTPWQSFPFQKLFADAAPLAALRGNQAQAKRWADAAAAMSEGLQKHLIDPSTHTVNPLGEDATRRHHSGQYDTSLALWCGILDQAQGLATCRALFAPTTSRINAPFHGLFVTEGLFAYGEDTAAVDFMRSYWGAMLRLNEHTYFDNFSLDWPAGSVVDRGTSLCHGWACGPLHSLPANVLGVRPAEPGFAKVLVAPQPGGLSWANGVVPTVRGPVSVNWQASLERFRLEVELPEKSGGRVSLPPFRGRPRTVLVGGRSAPFTWDGSRQVVEVRAGRSVVEQVE